MNVVREQIAIDLFNALYEANMADAWEDENENDLDPNASGDNNLYGALVDAIKFLGYTDEYDYWVNTGRRSRAYVQVN